MSKRKHKCGGFIKKNGVIIKRPGKKFVCPPMPDKMRMSYQNADSWVIDDIGEINAIRENNWKQARKKEYAAMRRLYYFQELVRFIRETAKRIILSKRRLVEPDVYGSFFERHL